MMPVVWSEEGLHSLELIYAYIFEDSPQNAEIVINTLLELGDSLSSFPEKYPIESAFNDKSIRFFPKWNFKIVYKIESNRIFVINVYSTRQLGLK
jgi:toxin ParE1/3/4